MTELKRLTTNYDPAEDRIRLTGIDDHSQVLCLWLTQRLLNRLVPYLCQALEGQGAEPSKQAKPKSSGGDQSVRTHVEQSFAQQSARAALPRQAPVIPTSESPYWRVEAVDVKHMPSGSRLVFKGGVDAEQAVLNLPTPALRQWLGIVFDQYRSAGWPIQIWPAWVQEGVSRPSVPQTVLLH